MPSDDTVATIPLNAVTTNEDHGISEIEHFVQIIRDTVLYQVEWKDLLSAAPQAIAKMGACYVAVTPSIMTLSLGSHPGVSNGLR